MAGTVGLFFLPSAGPAAPPSPPVASAVRQAVTGASDRSAAETPAPHVSVVSPPYCADVRGKTRVTLAAPGFQNVTVHCWKQGPGFGSDSTVATLTLDARGGGSFVFPADAYPHGPVTLTISAAGGTLHDNCYLQLYNRGGVRWREGMPKAPPPAARGLSLVFADDFTGPLSISSTDPKATYYPHKPPDGSQDFSTLPFTGPESAGNPFTQVDSYLRLRASEKAHSAGLISSLKSDGSGVKVALPCYFEARFVAPNAVGTWPAFWLLTVYPPDGPPLGDRTPVDELDIIEAYGGEGPREPNSGDKYQITPHAWNQGDAGKALADADYAALHNPASMHRAGIPSTWYETFHTYGCKITATDTIYYCDDIEMGRHPTLPTSKRFPFFFMINLATGGGWPVDLSRYNGLADMYVDYVRVYGPPTKGTP
ncbi:MAG: glycoside hydrolase family 16 protein [Armatimonadetes bacterium]|nr:glycoside hydrolase family 16 protein [Armatimonadota bacterium]